MIGVKCLDSQSMQTGEGWVLVFPRGKHFINKYELTLNCDDKFFGTVEDWWKNSTFKKPYLDKGHEFNERYGEFSNYRITDKGLEMYLVLNDAGKELVKSGKYEYLSPTFMNSADSTGRKFDNVVYSVSLVNSPALLVLDKIQEQIRLSAEGEPAVKKSKGGSRMELREVLAGKLKLNLASDDASILARVEELINSGATIDELKLEIEKLKGQVQTSAEKLTVAEAEKKKALDSISAIEEKTIADEAVKVIDEAIRLQQYHPSLKDMKVEQYKASKETVMKELSVIPKVESQKQKTASGVEGADSLDLSGISDEDKNILLDQGYDLNKPEDVALAKEFIKTLGVK